MAFTTHTLTGDVSDLIGTDFATGKVKATLEPSQSMLTDGTTEVRLGSIPATVATDGTFTITGVPSSAAGFPLYRVLVKWTPDKDALGVKGPQETATGWFEMTADRTLAWVVENTVEPTILSPTVVAQITAAAALGNNNDTMTASFLTDTGSATYAAASATNARLMRPKTDARQSATQPLLALPAIPPSPITQTLNATPASPVAIAAADAEKMVTFKGGVVQLTDLGGVLGWRNTTPDYFSTTGIQAIYSVEFDIMDNTNPLEVSLRLRDNNSSNGCRVWTWVDGVPQTDDFVSCGVTPSGGIFNWHLNLSATTGRRRVRVFLHSADFAGFNKRATSLIQPTPHTELKLGVLGDSWVQGSGDVLPGRTFLRTAALLMGADAYCDGQGGTGYVEATANANFDNYGDRLTGLAAAPIDYLIVEGSVNDDVNNNATGGTIQVAATALYDAWKVLRPDCPIVVIGVQSVGDDPTNGDTNADRVANNNAVKAAAEAHDHVLGFIDPLAEKWMVGTGNTTAPTGNGPADWAMNSAYHLSLPGSDMVAQRAAARILDVIGA